MRNEEPCGALAATFWASSLPSVVIDSALRVVAANAAYQQMSGRTAAELENAYTIDFIHADDLAETLVGFDRLVGGEPFVRQRRRHVRADGSWVEALVVSSRFEADGSQFLLVQMIDHEVAIQPLRQEALAEIRLRTGLQAFGDASCFHDEFGRILVTPERLARRLGRPAAWLYGRLLTDPELGAVTTTGDSLGPADDPVLESIRTGEEVIRTIGLTPVGGGVVWYSVRVGLVNHLDTVAARSTLRDVDELIEAQNEIRSMAAVVEQELAHRLDHDDLTGLKTRRALIELTDAALWAEEQVAVVFVDLDSFKAVNDDLGHLAGDEVLAAAAQVLQHLAPDEATLGRAGGDEFVLLARNLADAERFAESVHELSQRPAGLVTVRSRPVRASVGVAGHRPGDTRSDLFARADAAMYAAKRVRADDRRCTRAALN